MKFDPKKKHSDDDFQPIPAGTYPVRLRNFERKKSKKEGGGEYLNMEWEIIDGEYKKRRLWHIQSLKLHVNFVADRFGELILACGWSEVFDPEDDGALHKILDGAVTRAKVIQEEYEYRTDDGNYKSKTRNVIERFSEPNEEDKIAADDMELADSASNGGGGHELNKEDLDDVPFGG